MFQETLVTHEVLEILGIDEVKLIVSISEQEYERGKQIFTDNSGERGALLYLLRLLALQRLQISDRGIAQKLAR